MSIDAHQLQDAVYERELRSRKSKRLVPFASYNAPSTATSGYPVKLSSVGSHQGSMHFSAPSTCPRMVQDHTDLNVTTESGVSNSILQQSRRQHRLLEAQKTRAPSTLPTEPSSHRSQELDDQILGTRERLQATRNLIRPGKAANAHWPV